MKIQKHLWNMKEIKRWLSYSIPRGVISENDCGVYGCVWSDNLSLTTSK